MNYKYVRFKKKCFPNLKFLLKSKIIIYLASIIVGLCTNKSIIFLAHNSGRQLRTIQYNIALFRKKFYL